MIAAFAPDATAITLVKAFRQGEPIALPGTPATPAPAMAPHDLCLVKLNIGPGNPGPDDAPSTSAGIGVEVWLPAPIVWNQRLELWGDGGFSGRAEISDRSVIGAPEALDRRKIKPVRGSQRFGKLT
jgi:hypothetical protein